MNAVTAVAFDKVKSEPEVLFPGNSYKLLLTVDKTVCDTYPKDKPPFAQIASVESSSPSDLELETGTLKAVDTNPCQVILPVKVSKDATGADVTLLFSGEKKNGDAPLLGTLKLRVQLAKGPGPVPPGITPSLDVMWKVLPRKSVADSFGNRVADEYFAIEATFGNETGYDLQIAALGFEAPEFSCAADERDQHLKEAREHYPLLNDHVYDKCVSLDTKKNGITYAKPRLRTSSDTQPPLPVDAYPVSRSTIEREQSVGTRAIIVNLVRATGSILVGVGGFYPDGGAFVRTSGIISGPAEKALELVYPDLTTNHLIALDNRTLRDGAVVSNNAPTRINAFISRELVMCGAPRKFIFGQALSVGHDYSCDPGDARLPWQRNFDPNDVMLRLGELTLIGRKIQYLERVRVLTKAEDNVGVVPGPTLTQVNLTLKALSSVGYTVNGLNLKSAMLASEAPDLKIRDIEASDSSVKFTLDGKSMVPGDLGHYTLKVQTAHGYTLLPFDVVAPIPSLNTSVPLKANTSETIKIAGENLVDTSNEKVSITSDDSKLAISNVSATSDSEVSFDYTAKDAGSYEIKLKTAWVPKPVIIKIKVQ